MVPADANEPEGEPDTVLLEQRFHEHGVYNEALVYGFISACIGRVDVIRCSSAEDVDAMLSEMDEKLMACYRTFERDGINSTNVDEMLALVQQFATLDENFVDQQCAHQEFVLTGDEPDSEACIPSDMPEEYHWFEVAPPFEPHSPEHMAQWMIGRLSKRLARFVETGNIHKVKQYVERRQIMVSVINVCRRNPSQRRNALYMMRNITDLSDGESDEAVSDQDESSSSSAQ